MRKKGMISRRMKRNSEQKTRLINEMNGHKEERDRLKKDFLIIENSVTTFFLRKSGDSMLQIWRNLEVFNIELY